MRGRALSFQVLDLDLECATIGRRLGAFGHAIVADHRGDTQTIVGEQFGSSLGLGGTMLRQISPRGYGGVVLQTTLTPDQSDRLQNVLAGRR